VFTRGFKAKCENMSLQIRKELGLNGSDPLSARVLTEHLGVLLVRPSEIEGLPQETARLLLGKGKDAWSAVTISYGDSDIIIHNSSHSRARQASDIMHELAHILLDHEASKIIVSQPVPIMLREYNKNLEDEAAWFAGCLLLPRDALLLIRNVRMTDREACTIYEVSSKLLNYRINVTGVQYQIEARR